ncbi:MAG: hypothetical protein QNJ12_14195 [Ilumatobacter sp.]|uniref:hypothetical protein n=1 Tax=Ilumatobacter sp. TaxID=1967498 RepID=UPI0026224FC3|nr:hypothetical protein [Ilumatobacter sp.]MDJ0769947.1 hypothetical protein [Ilumatobacter sp.]
MSDDVKRSWQALGEQMSALGSLVHERLSAPGDDRDGGGRADGATEQIRAALEDVVVATRQLGERIGDVARDEDVRATATDTMGSLDDALRATVDLITERIEDVVGTASDDE